MQNVTEKDIKYKKFILWKKLKFKSEFLQEHTLSAQKYSVLTDLDRSW